MISRWIIPTKSVPTGVIVLTLFRDEVKSLQEFIRSKDKGSLLLPILEGALIEYEAKNKENT